MGMDSIREAAIRVKIVVTDDDPFRAATQAAQRFNATTREGNAQRSAGTTREMTSIREITSLKMRLARQEVQLTNELKKQNALLDQQKQKAKAVKDEKGPGFFGKVGGGLDRASSVAGKFAIPAAIAGMLPSLANAVAGVIEGIRNDIGGSKTQAREQGFLTGPLTKLGAALGLFVDVEAEMTKLVGAKQAELAGVMQLKAAEEDLIKKRLEGVQKEKTRVEGLLKEQEKLLESSQKSFGLLDSREKQEATRIAGLIKGGKLGELSKPELDFVKSSGVFSGLIDDQTKKAADAGGFQKFAELLGATQKRDQLQSQVDALVKQENVINIKVEQFDKLIDDLKRELRPLMDSVTAKAIDGAREEAKRAQRQLNIG